MENVKKYGDYKLINIPKCFQKLVNKSLFKYRHIINKTSVMIKKRKNKCTVELNKPIYIGMSILNYSKIPMYSFYYDKKFMNTLI